MLEKIHDFSRTHREQVIRISFGATFILRGIMQLFPWIFIPGITRNFVLYPHAWELVVCALGLAVVLIRWKPTIFRIFIVWFFSMILWSQILIFLFMFGKHSEDLTTPFWIFSILTILVWGYGNGLFLGILFDMMMVFLERKGYIKRKKLRKEKKAKKDKGTGYNT
jgi:hypothetical protein